MIRSRFSHGCMLLCKGEEGSETFSTYKGLPSIINKAQGRHSSRNSSFFFYLSRSALDGLYFMPHPYHHIKENSKNKNVEGSPEPHVKSTSSLINRQPLRQNMNYIFIYGQITTKIKETQGIENLKPEPQIGNLSP